MDDMIRGGVTLPQLTLPQVASLCAETDRECDDQSLHLSSQNANLLRGLSRRLGNAKSSTIKYLTGRDSNGKFVPAVELRSRTKVLSKAKQMDEDLCESIGLLKPVLSGKMAKSLKHENFARAFALDLNSVSLDRSSSHGNTARGFPRGDVFQTSRGRLEGNPSIDSRVGGMIEGLSTARDSWEGKGVIRERKLSLPCAARIQALRRELGMHSTGGEQSITPGARLPTQTRLDTQHSSSPGSHSIELYNNAKYAGNMTRYDGMMNFTASMTDTAIRQRDILLAPLSTRVPNVFKGGRSFLFGRGAADQRNMLGTPGNLNNPSVVAAREALRRRFRNAIEAFAFLSTMDEGNSESQSYNAVAFLSSYAISKGFKTLRIGVDVSQLMLHLADRDHRLSPNASVGQHTTAQGRTGDSPPGGGIVSFESWNQQMSWHPPLLQSNRALVEALKGFNEIRANALRATAALNTVKVATWKTPANLKETEDTLNFVHVSRELFQAFAVAPETSKSAGTGHFSTGSLLLSFRDMEMLYRQVHLLPGWITSQTLSIIYNEIEQSAAHGKQSGKGITFEQHQKCVELIAKSLRLEVGNNKCQDILLDQTSLVLDSTKRIKRGLTVDVHVVRAFARIFRAICNEKTFYHFCSDFISVTRPPKHVIRDALAGGTKGEKSESAHGLDSVDGLDKQDGTSGEGTGARSAVGAKSLIELDSKRPTNAVFFAKQGLDSLGLSNFVGLLRSSGLMAGRNSEKSAIQFKVLGIIFRRTEFEKYSRYLTRCEAGGGGGRVMQLKVLSFRRAKEIFEIAAGGLGDQPSENSGSALNTKEGFQIGRRTHSKNQLSFEAYVDAMHHVAAEFDSSAAPYIFSLPESASKITAYPPYNGNTLLGNMLSMYRECKSLVCGLCIEELLVLVEMMHFVKLQAGQTFCSQAGLALRSAIVLAGSLMSEKAAGKISQNETLIRGSWCAAEVPLLAQALYPSTIIAESEVELAVISVESFAAFCNRINTMFAKGQSLADARRVKERLWSQKCRRDELAKQSKNVLLNPSQALRGNNGLEEQQRSKNDLFEYVERSAAMPENEEALYQNQLEIFKQERWQNSEESRAEVRPKTVDGREDYANQLHELGTYYFFDLHQISAARRLLCEACRIRLELFGSTDQRTLSSVRVLEQVDKWAYRQVDQRNRIKVIERCMKPLVTKVAPQTDKQIQADLREFLQSRGAARGQRCVDAEVKACGLGFLVSNASEDDAPVPLQLVQKYSNLMYGRREWLDSMQANALKRERKRQEELLRLGYKDRGDETIKASIAHLNVFTEKQWLFRSLHDGKRIVLSQPELRGIHLGVEAVLTRITQNIQTFLASDESPESCKWRSQDCIYSPKEALNEMAEARMNQAVMLFRLQIARKMTTAITIVDLQARKIRQNAGYSWHCAYVATVQYTTSACMEIQTAVRSLFARRAMFKVVAASIIRQNYRCHRAKQILKERRREHPDTWQTRRRTVKGKGSVEEWNDRHKIVKTTMSRAIDLLKNLDHRPETAGNAQDQDVDDDNRTVDEMKQQLDVHSFGLATERRIAAELAGKEHISRLMEIWSNTREDTEGERREEVVGGERSSIFQGALSKRTKSAYGSSDDDFESSESDLSD